MEQFKAIMHEYPSEVNIKIVTHAVECVKGLLKEDLAAFEKEWITECVLSKPMELLVLISQKKHEDAWNKVIEKSFEMLGEMVETWSGHLDTYSEALVKTSIQTFTPHVRKRGFKCVISLVKSSLQAEVSTPLLLRILSDPDETLSARVPVAELIGVVCERRPETVGNIYKDIWRTYLCVLENSKLSDSLIGGVLTGMNGLFKEFGEELPIVELNNLYDSVTSSYIHKKSCRMACVDLLANHCRLFRERVLRDADVKPALWNILCAEKNTTECVMAALDHIYDMVFQHGTPASAHMEDLHKHEVNHFRLPSPKQTQKPSSYLVMFRYQFVGLPVSRRLLHRFLVEEIFTADLYPKTRSQITQMKNMANRIISKTIGKYRNLISEEIIDKFNRDVVEISSKVLFEAHQKMLTLRMAESFQYDHSFVQCMDQACWLAPLNHSNSENLFRLLVLGYRLTPKRKDVVHCLLTSHGHRAVAVSFLISETCVLNLDGSKTQNFEQYQLLWRDLFDSRNGTDALVLENAQFVFDDFVNCLTLFMESLLENDCNISSEESRARLSVMLELAACVMEMENVREWRREHVPYLLDAALRLQDACGVTVGMLRVMPILLADLTVEREGPLHVRCVEVCSSLDVSRCSDEPLLCLTCLALANVPQHFVQDIKIILEAFKLLFSRKDVEAKVLVTSLEKFGKLLQNGSVKNYEPIVIEIIIMLKNLHYNINVSDHHGRLLRRNILLFIGKYGTLLDERSIPKVIVLRHIKDSLFLQLPNYIDGSSFKLNLHRILHLAIEGEDAESLHSLLLIICANAEIVGKLHQIEEVVVCVIHKLCRCYSRGEVAGNVQDLEQAMLLFSCGGCVRALLECIINEISPGVRKMLSDILTSVLQHDPLSDATEEAVRIMVERCCLMLESVQATSKRAGLDLTLTVLEALANSNALTTRYLPDLLVLTLRTQENDFQTTFDALADYFKQKSDLFDVQAMDKITDELFKSISEAKYISSVYLKIIEKCLNVVKYINISKDNNEAIFELYTKHFTLICDDKIYFAQAICVLSKMSSILDFNMELKRSISHFGNYAILNEAIKWAQSFYNKRFDMETYFLFESFMDLLIEYSHVFLEFKYQNTLELLSILISTLPVLYLKRLNKKIGMCMQCFAESWGCAPPHSFTNSVHMWLKSQQIDAITDQLNNCIVVGDSAAVVHGIKLMLKIMRLNKNQSIFCDDIYEKIKSWVIIIQKLHNRHFQVKDKFKMAALSDSLEISLYFMTDNEILKLIIDSQAAISNNLTFYQKYIAAFTHCLLNNQVLSDGRLSSHLPRLLYEILCYFGTKTCSKEECDVVLDLVDKNWSVIEGSSSVSTLCITTAISKLPHKDRLSLTSRPATWLLSEMARDDLTLSQRIVFMETLSGFLFNQENTQLLSSAVQGHSAALPTRLSELTCRSDPRAFTVILDALAVCGNRSLLDTVCWMVSAEESSGWWDEAIDECMASLSTRNDTQVAVAIYDNYDSCHIFTIKPISQMLVPLLRHSTSRYNEEFFSKTITKILDCLNRTYKEKTNESLYRRLMTKQTASFMLLQVMFQKVSASSLESPSSLLHCSLNTSGKKPWFLAAEVCSLCVTLRQPCCFDTEQTKIIHRQFQCSNYNCMVSVLCKRKPAVKFYERLFQDNLWSLIFDCEKTYTLYIDAQGKSSTRRHLVAPSMENISGLTARTCTLNTYNPLFLRTLSDNPLKYDLLDNTAEEEIITQEIILRDNELNAHPCVSSISALLCHLSSLTDDQPPYWITKMAATLMADNTPVNIKWFISQIIVNGKDEIRKYSSLLLRPLAAVVVNTAQIQDGGKYLNGLHIEILRALHTWSEDSNLCADTLSECVRLLVDTCYFHKHRKYVRKSVLSTMEELVGNCGGGGTVPLEAITRDSDDATKEVSLEIQILFTKNNIYIPGLLKHVTDHIKYFDDYPTKTIELSKLFGLAVKTCQSDSEKSDSLRKFHAFLDKKRSNFNAYVKILYYTQVECHECVDDKSFSHITDLAPKMTTTHKDKCYTILSNYISHVRERDDHIIEMFASINIPEFILEKDAYIGVNLAKNGLTLLDNSVKKQIVSLVCEVCDTCNWKIRKVCYELLLNAYRDILNEQPSEPSAKRGNITKASSIISCVTSSDVYTRNVLGTLGRALMDQHHVIHSQVFDGFIQILDKSDLATRFCEILSLTMVLPFSRNSGNRETTSAMGGRCVATAVKLWLHVFRDNDNFRRKLLRENPLQISSSLNDDVPSKLLTMSKTYQGTFRSNSVVPSRSVRGDAAKGNKNVLNVQVPVDVLLEKLIVFAENNLAVSSEFFLEVFNMVLAICTEQQTKPILRDLVSCLLLNSPPVLLGTTIQMARALMDQCVDVQSLVKNAERLRARYVGSEAEMITRLLHEEAMLHTNQAVVLSSINEQDFSMLEHNDEFSLKDVAAMFGKLANWEDLTLQSTERFRNGQLPVLWTDDQRFTHALENYSDNSWICKARDVYLGNTIKTFDWLSEAGAWPINFFQLSTITEAIDIKSQLNDEENDLSNVLCDHVLTQRQCLAQWSVRLMLRSVMTKQLSSNSDSQTLNCRSSELKWCMEANRRGLDSMALQCIQRNQRQLVASESLPWLLQQVHALTSRGLRLGQREDLLKALHKSETYLDSFRNVSDKETIFSMNRVILQLKYQMNLLSEENLEPILTEMSKEFSEQSHKSEHVMSELRAAHKIAFLYFCDNLDTPEESQYVNIVRNALKVLKDIFNLKLVSNLDGPVAYILHKLNKITNTNIYNECATRIFDVLEDHVEYLDNIILEETNRILTKLPQDSHEKYVKLQKKLFKDPANIIRLKLLRSPDYTLEQYVSSLLAAVQKQDEYEWNQTFVKIISNLYEVKEGGASYRLLTKYRPHLEGIRAYDSCKKFRKNAERVLKNILKSLKPQQVQQHLLLNDVCPSLCELGRSLSDAHRRDLDDLLRLPRGLSVFRFDKQLKVFTNSVKRPVLLRAVLSDGSSKSFLVKTGEDLRTDAGAQFVQNYCNTLTLTRAVTYNVTPLGADAGVIYYLEGHVTVRDLLLAHYPHINQIANNRVKDEQLILQTQTARHNQYNEICKKVPSFALRNCIINECESVEDFISKKSNYLTSLTSLTINHWILGVGDRHLENVLYARGSGAVCGVDWAAILEHTVHAYSHAPELTPARLTRNMLSVVQDISLLESRLQMNLKSLRDDHKMLTAIMSVAFQFMADPNSDTFQQKLKHIENKLKGSVLPFEVTRAVLSGSAVLHKHAYLQLLDQLFGHVRQRDTYTIEEQIYYLLRQCIDESIMQVTRSGWEPWL